MKLRCAAALVVTCAACTTSSTQQMQDDLCADKTVIAGGSVQLGLDEPFTSINNGQDANLVQGLQGLWMFVMNVRAQDMNLGSDALQGIVLLSATDAMANEISLDTGCHIREFAAGSDGYSYLTTAFLLPMSPNYTNQIEGSTLTFSLTVHDQEGHYATDTHSVIAHFPSN